MSFDLTGAAIPLEAIEKIQTARLPVGGQPQPASARARPSAGAGTARHAASDRSEAGQRRGGQFRRKSGFRRSSFDRDDRIRHGARGGYPASWTSLSEAIIPLQPKSRPSKLTSIPFLASAMHLSQLNGHSLVDGHFAIAGFAARPETIAVEANLSRITFDLRKSEVGKCRTRAADLPPGRSARRAGEPARDRHRLSRELVRPALPAIEPSICASTARSVFNCWPDSCRVWKPAAARRSTQPSAGTLSTPRFNGKVHIEGASLRYGDFPAGLSNVAGDFNFDATRMVFENVTSRKAAEDISTLAAR